MISLSHAILSIIVFIVPLMIAVAYFTLAERKIMAAIQRRRGPDTVGFLGLLQPIADGLKLFLKETILPTNSSTFLFILSPVISFTLSLIIWAVIPLAQTFVIADVDAGLLYIFTLSSVAVYGVLTSGWASNSKYAFLGALRSAAQMVSYEISMGFIVINVVLCSGSLNLTEIVEAQEDIWYVFPLSPLAVMFFISCLAETNRHPFDLPEAEAELVSGYNVEYSAMGFALFFLAEYSNMLAMSGLMSILFLGGWQPFPYLDFLGEGLTMGIKICFFVVLFIWARASLPRYRYDQLMEFGWKCMLPVSMSFVLVNFSILSTFGWLPN